MGGGRGVVQRTFVTISRKTQAQLAPSLSLLQVRRVAERERGRETRHERQETWQGVSVQGKGDRADAQSISWAGNCYGATVHFVFGFEGEKEKKKMQAQEEEKN